MCMVSAEAIFLLNFCFGFLYPDVQKQVMVSFQPTAVLWKTNSDGQVHVIISVLVKFND